MTLTEMRYIVALMRERHFGRAAYSCHVSQPTLSVAVRKVEERLKVTLFERSAAEVRPTPVGTAIAAQAERVLEEALRVEEIAAQGRDPLKGSLRIGVIYTIAPYLLPLLVPQLNKRAPAMPLYLREDFTANLVADLKRGDLDVIVVALPIAESGLVSQGVYDEPFRVVVPAGHPWAGRAVVGAGEVESENLLLLGQGNCFRDQVLQACPRASEGGASGAVEASSLETIRCMVASGAGIAVMPSAAADPLRGREPLLAVVPFSDPEPVRRVGIVWRVSFPRSKAIEAVKGAMAACALAGVRSA